MEWEMDRWIDNERLENDLGDKKGEKSKKGVEY